MKSSPLMAAKYAVTCLPAFLLCALLLIGSTDAIAAGSGATVTTVSIPASPVPSGTIAMLQAMVTADGAPVAVGFVTFREGSVALGTASLQANGTATLPVWLPPGRFAISARFNGSNAGQPSVSQAATLTQLGASSVAVLVGNKVKGHSMVTATVTGNQPTNPTGSVVFFDATAGKSLGSVELTAGTTQSSLQPALLPPAVGTYWNLLAAQNVLAGDFNGDGIEDYAELVSDNATGGSRLIAFLGQADGTYVQAPASGTDVLAIMATGDFNNDGKTDLLVEAGFFNTTTAYLSNGDGTFTAQNLNDGFGRFAGDFNGDGKMDVLEGLGSRDQNTSVLFGDGTGNFTQGPIAQGGETGPTADYNNDGNLDLIAQLFGANGPPANSGDYLGDGTGNYASVTPIDLPNFIPTRTNVPAADFNGDGNLDVADYDGSGNIEIQLGDGKGNFATPAGEQIIPTGPLLGYSVLDVNGDGIVDIVAVLQSSVDANGVPSPTPNVLVLLGRGDGQFAVSNGVASVPVTYPLLGSNGITSLPASATATASITVSEGKARHTIVAMYGGNGILPASTSK